MSLDAAALDLIFRKARSINVWLPKPVADDQIRSIYEVMKWGSDVRKLLTRTHPLSAYPGGKGTIAASVKCSECGKNDERTGRRNHR